MNITQFELQLLCLRFDLTFCAAAVVTPRSSLMSPARRGWHYTMPRQGQTSQTPPLPPPTNAGAGAEINSSLPDEPVDFSATHLPVP